MNNNTSHSHGTHSIKPARLIRADGSEQPIRPSRGKSFEYSELCAELNCETTLIAPLHNGNVMVFDYHATSETKPCNNVATLMAAHVCANEPIRH